MKKTKVVVHRTKNATKEERVAFMEAARQYEIELNTYDFWDDVYLHYPSWRHNNGLSFSEFTKLVLEGQDKFENSIDYVIRVSVEFYYSARNVVGYTYPTTWLTWINRRLFKNFDLGDIAGNQSHEGLHNIGLGHPGTDKGSVVYQFGYLVRKRIKARLNLAGGRKTQVIKRSIWSRIKSFFRRW